MQGYATDVNAEKTEMLCFRDLTLVVSIKMPRGNSSLLVHSSGLTWMIFELYSASSILQQTAFLHHFLLLLFNAL